MEDNNLVSAGAVSSEDEATAAVMALAFAWGVADQRNTARETPYPVAINVLVSSVANMIARVSGVPDEFVNPIYDRIKAVVVAELRSHCSGRN